MLRLIASMVVAIPIFALSCVDAFAKSPPPGSGTDDVPANILLLLDTSGSMDTVVPAGDSQYPVDMAFDSLGNIYIAKYYDVVEKYDSLGNFLFEWGSHGTGNGKFDFITAIAVDSSGNVYVTDKKNKRVQKFDSSGNYLMKFGLKKADAYGVAVDSSGNVYAINGDDDIEKFDSSGTRLATWSLSNSPRHIVIDGSNNLYVTFYGNSTVKKYNPSGTQLSSFAVTKKPYGIEISSTGTLYISAIDNDKIYEYNTSGTLLNTWGSTGTAPGQWKQPRGVAKNSSNVVFIADHLNHRVQTVTGTLLIVPEAEKTRLESAVEVIKAIVSDSNLTSGANFGLMKWNTNSTMLVDVTATGASQIYTTVDTLVASGSTVLDNAMDLAQSYFLGPTSPMIPGATCQQNILIVISDGYWVDNTASNTADYLYTTYGIKTFTVGFTTTDNINYTTLSQKGGSYPDSPLYAENQNQFLSVLSNFIQQIISSKFTFTAPTIIPSAANDESILQSTFTYKDDNQWKGRLLKYELLPDGNVGNLLWDAGALLNNKAADSRNLWTVATGLSFSLNNFTITDMDYLRLPIEEYSGSTLTDPELTNLIEFIRGKDSYLEFPTGVDDEGDTLLTGERWKLADIYHSKSAIVGYPSAYYSDASGPNTESYYRYLNNYKGFVDGTDCGSVCADRDEVIYVGSNGGMLHAFLSETGEELWGFVPPSVLPNFKGAIGLQPATSNSIYAVDGTPTVKDIYYGGHWHTVLMGGLRQGGNSYYALDVTDPNNPTHLFTISSRPTNNVVSYWDSNGVRTNYNTAGSIPAEYDFRKLGESWSQPVIAKIKISGNDKWVALVAGGYNNAINPGYGAVLYVLDMEDGGKILKEIALADNNPTNSIVNSVPPKVTVINADSTTLFTGAGAIAYVTDLEAKLWAVNLTDQGTLYDKTQIFDSQATDANGRYSFHELAATITSNSQLILYFGTGNVQALSSTSANIQNRAYGILETNFPTYTNMTPFTITSLQDTTTGATCPSGSQKGWYINLNANEKLAAKATVSNNTVFLSRYTPDSTALCSAGTSTLTEVDFTCGTQIRDTDLGLGVPTEAIVYENKVYIGVSDDTQGSLPTGFVKSGNLIVGDPAVISTGDVRLESWKENF